MRQINSEPLLEVYHNVYGTELYRSTWLLYILWLISEGELSVVIEC